MSVDARTTYLNLPKPAPNNPARGYDVPRLAVAFDGLDAWAQGVDAYLTALAATVATNAPRIVNASYGIGSEVLAALLTGANHVAVGPRAGMSLTTGNNTTLVGFEAGRKINEGTNNTGFGYRALVNMTDGNNNAAFGYRSMFYATAGVLCNTAIGYSALHGGHFTVPTSAFTGVNNTAVGLEAMYYSATGADNVAVGYRALNGSDNRPPLAPTNSASRNTAIGFESLRNVDTGNDNVGIGWHAGMSLTTGSNNTLVGEEAGILVSTGSRNTLIGSDIHPGLSTGNDNIIIGYGASAVNSGASFQLSIGNTIRGDLSQSRIGITDGTAGPATAFHINHATPVVRIQDRDSAGNAANPQIHFYDSTVRVGLVGKVATSSPHLWLSNDMAGGNVVLSPGTGGVIDAQAPIRLPTYTVGTLPSASTMGSGAVINCSDLGGGSGLLISNGTAWRRVARGGAQTIATDAAVTLTTLADAEDQRHTGALTADRAVTLAVTNAIAGSRFRLTRTGGGAFNLSLGGLKNLATNTWAEVTYDGSAWFLAAYGAL